MERKENNILRLMHEIEIGLQIFASSNMKHKDLSLSRMHMLSEILRLMEEKKEIHFSTLVKELGVSKAAVSATLKDLEDLKYLEIRRCREDGRRKLIVPSLRAIYMKTEIEEVFSKMTETLFSGMDEKETGTFEFILKKIIRNIKDIPNKENRIQDDSITDLYQGI